jgi:hypothetical protein
MCAQYGISGTALWLQRKPILSLALILPSGPLPETLSRPPIVRTIIRTLPCDHSLTPKTSHVPSVSVRERERGNYWPIDLSKGLE